jgi:NAD+ synthase (glutamine-hydrolysing)
MKIALAQINYITGDITGNVSRIISEIEHCKQQGADLVVFAELAVSGYPALDMFEYPHFIEACDRAVEKIAAACRGIAAIIGAPVRNLEPRGKKLYNAACFLENGEVASVHHKLLLPDYDVFDEYRYFEPADKLHILHYQGKKIALTICEDMWEVGEPTLYDNQPLEILCRENPDFIINIAASPFNIHQAEFRKAVIRKNAARYALPIYYVNQVGAHTDIIFDGGSMYADREGNIIHELSYFQEETRLIDPAQTILQPRTDYIERIEQALVLGLKDYFGKMGFKKALIGLSGGIDSAVTAVLACKALGAGNVTGVLMPSPYSSGHSVKDAEDLVANLGCNSWKLPIEQPFNAFLQTLEEPFKGLDSGLAEENLQARIRGTLLMALSNKLGGILLNTTNKSEAAVGYGTLYGDMCGGIAVLGDVYKTDVFKLARHLNRDGELIPENTIVKPPSAELRPNQKDSDSLPEYEVLDPILKLHIEGREGKTAIVAEGYPEATVDKVLRLVHINEYKRFQAPPILRMTSKAFGSGRKMPLVAKYS